MKHRIIFGVVGIVFAIILVFGGLGCANGGSAQADPFVRQSAFEAYKTQLVTAFDQKADKQSTQNALDNLKDDIRDIEAPTDVYTKQETYTKAEVDQIINTLKNNQSWITANTGSTGGGTSGGSVTGQVTWTTNPTNVQTLGSTQVCFTLQFANGTNTWVYVRPTININLHTGQSPLGTALITGHPSSSVTLTAGGGSANYVNGDFSAIGTTSSIQLTPITMNGTGTGEFQLGAGQSTSILVCIQMSSAIDPRIWDVTAIASWRSL